jgi:hypothetical protein
MKNFILTLLMSIAVFSTPTLVFAQPDIGSGDGGLMKKVGGVAQYNVATTEFTLSETVGRVIKMVLMLIGTIFFVLAVYAGFLWMSAQGNEQQVTKAKDILRAATIGMVVIIASYSITAMVMLLVARSTQ